MNPEADGYTHDIDLTYEAGMDVKLGLSDNVTLDLTLNTDFAQVEADDQQVNLTRFSLFFPERRQFSWSVQQFSISPSAIRTVYSIAGESG